MKLLTAKATEKPTTALRTGRLEASSSATAVKKPQLKQVQRLKKQSHLERYSVRRVVDLRDTVADHKEVP